MYAVISSVPGGLPCISLSTCWERPKMRLVMWLLSLNIWFFGILKKWPWISFWKCFVLLLFFFLNWKCSPVFSLVICPANSCGKWCWFMNFPSGNKHPPWRGGGRKGFALQEGHVLGLGGRCWEGHTDGEMHPGKHSSESVQGPWGPVSSETSVGGLCGWGRRLNVRPLKNEWRDVGMKECSRPLSVPRAAVPLPSRLFLCTSSVSKLQFQLIIS